MAAAFAAASAAVVLRNASDRDYYLIREVRHHEFAFSEPYNIPSRPVYHKNGDIFSRSSIERETTSQKRKEKSPKKRNSPGWWKRLWTLLRTQRDTRRDTD